MSTFLCFSLEVYELTVINLVLIGTCPAKQISRLRNFEMFCHKTSAYLYNKCQDFESFRHSHSVH